MILIITILGIMTDSSLTRLYAISKAFVDYGLVNNKITLSDPWFVSKPKQKKLVWYC
jgi:hypothetical protein